MLVDSRQKKEAREAFVTALSTRRQPDGTYKFYGRNPDDLTAAYFLDVISEQEYADRLAGDKRFSCLPWFYIGQRREIEGNRQNAISAYRRSVELGSDKNAHSARTLAQWWLKQLVVAP